MQTCWDILGDFPEKIKAIQKSHQNVGGHSSPETSSIWLNKKARP